MDETHKIKVLLADDHTMFRKGIRLLLEGQGDFEVVSEAATTDETLEQAHRTAPDVAVLDITMPGNGLEATRRLQNELPKLRILILTMHGGDQYFFQALEAGAAGYVLKEGAPGDLAGALRAVANGEVFIYPSLATRLVGAFLKLSGRTDEESHLSRLSTREREVMALIARGLTNQQIADELYVSVHTIRTHRARIMEKLGMHNRAELMRYAILLGLKT
jgi:two-component system, NarL family, response regulator NreC